MSNETTLDDVLGLVASVGDREIELDAGDSPTCLFIGADEVHCFDRPDLAEMLATLLPYLRAHGDELRAALEDARRLDWLEAQQGSNLVSDDDCRWAVSDSGFQPVPEEGGFTEDVAITAFVEPETWAPTIRAAIDAALEIK